MGFGLWGHEGMGGGGELKDAEDGKFTDEVRCGVRRWMG